MGNITQKQVREMKAAGKIDDTQIAAWTKLGIIKEPKQIITKFLKSKNGNLVKPEIVFGGLKGDEYSNEMLKFKAEFQKLIDEYCFELKEKK